MSYSPLRAMPLVSDDSEKVSTANHSWDDDHNSYNVVKRHEPNLMDYLTDAASNDAIYSSLQATIEANAKKQNSDKQAKSLLTRVLLHIAKSQEERAIKEADEEASSSIFDLAVDGLKFLGKKIIQFFIEPLLSLTFNIVRTIASFAIRSIFTYIIAPILEGALALLIANPITLLAGVAIGGTAWFLWNKFFNKSGMDAEAISNQISPNQIHEGYGSTEISKDLKQSPYVTRYQPVQMAHQGTQVKIPKGTKFSGFGTDIDAYIKEASQLFNMDEGVLRGFVKMEDGWTGKMSPTGAIGTGQFIYSTWNGLAATTAGKAIGMVPIIYSGRNKTFRTEADPRFNMRVNTLATALLARQNADQLIKHHLPVTGENLYMMHNIGPGILNVMLGYPVSKSTITAMQQNGMKAGMSPADFLTWQQSRFNQQYAIANASPVTLAESNAPSSKPVTVDKPAISNTTKSATQAKQIAPLTTQAPAEKTLVKGKGNTVIAIR